MRSALYRMAQLTELRAGDIFSPSSLACPASQRFWTAGSQAAEASRPQFRVLEIDVGISRREIDASQLARLKYVELAYPSRVECATFNDFTLAHNLSTVTSCFPLILVQVQEK
jgi:hypothetical protein